MLPTATDYLSHRQKMRTLVFSIVIMFKQKQHKGADTFRHVQLELCQTGSNRWGPLFLGICDIVAPVVTLRLQLALTSCYDF